MIFYTADLHLGHEAVISLSSRPFSSVEEMDEALICTWNKKVKKNDTVYIVGDLIYKSDDPEKYLPRLKGKKILITGNHDHSWLKKVDGSKYFEEIIPLLERSVDGKVVTFSHYPLVEWRKSRLEPCKKLGYHIHGHIHSRTGEGYIPLFCKPNALNAGVDVNGFAPVTMEELIANNSAFKHRCLADTPYAGLFKQREEALKKVWED